MTLSPILNEDIPTMFNLRTSQAIVRLLYELSTLTNGEFNVNKSSSRSGISRSQIIHYIDILEKKQILKKVYQVNGNGTYKRYRYFKVYINPHFHLWLLNKNFKSLDNSIIGHIVESYWLFATTQIDGYYKQFGYYKNKDGKEIDFVSKNSMGNPPFKTLHEFKYVQSAKSENYLILLTIPSINKVVWCKEDLESENGIIFENIIRFKNAFSKK